MRTVRLYTRQDIRSLKEIEEKGYFTNKKIGRAHV